MTGIINSAASLALLRQQQVQLPEVKQAVVEAPTLDPETRSRLKQLKPFADRMSSASERLLPLTEELAERNLSAAGPATAEALNDAVATEEFKRKKPKECALVADLRHALHASDRSQADFLRALPFLMPGIQIEEEDGVSVPGFAPPMENPADLDTSGLIWNSHADFFAQISALLEVLKTEWLSKYQESLGKFLDFYKEFSDIMEKLKFEAYDDKGAVKVDFREVKQALDALARKYGMDSQALASFPSKEQAEAFVASLGLSSSLVVTQSGGTFHVKMDMTSVNSIKDSMTVPANGQQFWMDAAHYNSWLSAKDSNVEQIKHMSKMLGEKLNEMTQKFDNIVKILSSSIEKMSEANNAYVHNT